MNYEEFCTGVGMKVDRTCYERIEQVYMAFNRFASKKDICDFYQDRDMNGIETLYTALLNHNNLVTKRNRLEGEITALTKQLNETIGEIHKTALLCGIQTT